MSRRPATPVRRVASTRLPTRWGVFQTLAFERDSPRDPARVETAVVLVMGDVSTGTPLLRIHSQCLTGELFGSLRCDCAQQLDVAMRAIGDEGCGVLIYEHQEGRGIGLVGKLQAYALQDYGFDTVDANEALGYLADQRDFALPCAILDELGVRRVRLLSNNPAKVRALDRRRASTSPHACRAKRKCRSTRSPICAPNSSAWDTRSRSFRRSVAPPATRRRRSRRSKRPFASSGPDEWSWSSTTRIARTKAIW